MAELSLGRFFQPSRRIIDIAVWEDVSHLPLTLGRHGVEANATERAIRGRGNWRKKDGIYRAALRGDSTHMRRRVEEAARYIARGEPLPVEPGKVTMVETRRSVTRGWLRVAKELQVQGQYRLAERLYRFLQSMPPIATDRERILGGLVERIKTCEQVPTR